MKKKMSINNQDGFTLIEIIAVIIIMGILAAVAVPKFFSMQEDAKIAALNGALSEGAARFNHAYARFILDSNRAPTGVPELTTAAYLGAAADTGEDLGDFSIKYSNAADVLTIEVTAMASVGDAAEIARLKGLDALNTTKVIDNVTWGN